MSERMLETAEIAAALGVAPATVSQWRSRSKPGRQYASRPFPEPDETYGQTPVWSEDRLPEIRAWVANRPGMGVGGGRPRKAPDTLS